VVIPVSPMMAVLPGFDRCQWSMEKRCKSNTFWPHGDEPCLYTMLRVNDSDPCATGLVSQAATHSMDRVASHVERPLRSMAQSVGG